MNKFYIKDIKRLQLDDLSGIGTVERFSVETSWLPLTVWLSLDGATLYFRPDNQMSRYLAHPTTARVVVNAFRHIAHKTPQLFMLPAS